VKSQVEAFVTSCPKCFLLVVQPIQTAARQLWTLGVELATSPFHWQDVVQHETAHICADVNEMALSRTTAQPLQRRRFAYIDTVCRFRNRHSSRRHCPGMFSRMWRSDRQRYSTGYLHKCTICGVPVVPPKLWDADSRSIRYGPFPLSGVRRTYRTFAILDHNGYDQI
jgi:hypothetical protein